ncbi:SHOCT domain-containing protein [Natrinema ejinorense]|uniref:SHOCT domain-containing protein n=1 Tax=Natrinema ejinorense TaxID=373386 RepID=A0A2A5QR34_9EURY|nr:hypothetical protein [Natrinema ejinorense]PCR89213.1 hypothetical protein CP557_00855 [Natrinema ejinorense]
MGRLSSVLLKGIGVLVLAFVVLSVVGTIVGIALSVLATVLSVIVTVAVLAVFVLAIIGLGSLVGGGTERDSQPPERSGGRVDPEAHLRSRYVAGELGDAEFERELEGVLDADDFGAEDGIETGRSRRRHRER